MEIKKCLNGFWDFSIDLKSADDMPGQWEDHQICVPSPFNINGFSKGIVKKTAGEEFYVQGGDFCLYPDYPRSWDTAVCGAYRRMFYVPEESKGKRIFLLFDAVAYYSKFYVNGICLREETEGFLPIEIEVTDAVRFGGDNEILVVAENAKRFMYKDESGRNRLDYPKGSFWGEYIAGIWQDVWYVERPETYIKDVFVVTDIWQEKLTAKFELDGPVKEGIVRFSLKEVKSGEYRTLGEVPVSEGIFEWRFHEEEVKYWETEDPVLYQLKAELLTEGEAADSKCVRFGFRSFTVQGDKFYLNKRPINLKNDSWHYMGYSVQTPEYARSYYKMAKDAGVNIIRLHAQPFPSFFYDVADEMGMLLVSESAVWASHCNFSYNDAFFENSKKHLIRLILRDRNHPSVVLWSPENECIMAHRVCGSQFIKDEQELEAKLYDFMKVIYEYDTSRPISCDGSGDLGGRLSVNSLHYPGFNCPTHKGKPITIGEMGSMYYSTPDMVCMERGQETLLSLNNRLQAVGEDAYRNLMGERRWASQVCVFNLIWYGLEPLPFRDRLLTYEDYSAPGIKPGRITPYLRTLNAGADESLPEYIPNPVFKLTQEAYLPVRSYIDHMPKQAYTKERSVLPLFLFYDAREDGMLQFVLTLEKDGKVIRKEELNFEMKACEAKETTVSVCWPEEEGRIICRSRVLHEGKTIFEESAEVEVSEEETLRKTFEAMEIPCVSAENERETGEGIFCIKSEGLPEEQVYEVPCVFDSDRKFAFNKAHLCVRKETDEINGKALYFDGSGQALVWYAEAGKERRIYSAIDLSEPKEAADWKLLIELGKYLKSQETKQPKKIVFYGTESSPYAALLKKLRFEFETVDGQKLERMLQEKQDGILFAEGAMDMDFLSNISRNNFDTVVLAGIKKAPHVWYSEFDVTERRCYHAYPLPEAVKKFGVYGNSLYGLTEGKECLIGQNLLEYRKAKEGTIAWKIPDTDWRMWNKDPEQLKTVSHFRSEQTDNSRLALLSFMEKGESHIWINQLLPDADHPRRTYLWKCFLTGLGAVPRIQEAEKAEQEAAYDQGLNCLWIEESGEMLTKEQKIPGGKKIGCLIYSPQDRTNFLYNPDMVHMEIHGQRPLRVYLNGELLGEGENLRFTSISLKAGDNTFTMLSDGEQVFPEILFERGNGEKLDLVFKNI